MPVLVAFIWSCTTFLTLRWEGPHNSYNFTSMTATFEKFHCFQFPEIFSRQRPNCWKITFT